MLKELRLAVRTLRRQPGFTVVALLVLALGSGGAIAMFSLMNTLLLRPLPYPDSDRLVRVYRTAGAQRAWPHSVPNFLDQRAQNTVFSGMAAFEWRSFALAEPGQPAEQLKGLDVTGDFFAVLGVQPVLGRSFLPEEEQHRRNQAVVLSHNTWQSRFAGDPAVVGRRLRIDGEPVTVVGVMPASFDYPLVWGQVELWRPFGFSPAIRQARNDNWLQSVARLRPGVTLGKAQAEMSAIADRLGEGQPVRSGLRLLPLHRSGMDETGVRLTWLSMGLAVLVMLIVCVNLAGVQLARLAARAREQAIRAALGASRAQLVRQSLAESLLLALIGGALGVGLADWCIELLSARILVDGRAGVNVALDGRVLVFALALVLVTALAVGLLPAWSGAGAGLTDALKRGGLGTTDRSQPRLRQLLVVVQLALALVLLGAGGLFVRGLQSFVARDPGWRIDGLLTAQVNLPAAKFNSADLRRVYFERLEERLSALPGVEHAAISWELPITSFPPTSHLVVEGAPPPLPGHEPRLTLNGVSPDFFATLGIPLLAGRAFTPADGDGAAEVAIVNEALARHYFPGADAIGKRIARAGTPLVTIVGVVGDVRLPAKLSAPVTRFQVYRPLAQGARHGAALMVRGRLQPEALAGGLRAAVVGLDADVPLHKVQAAREAVDLALANFALTGGILGGFAVLGLLLAALGVYGLFSVFVVHRTREIGVRVALGANDRQVLWLVLGKGLRLALAGALIGGLGALAVSSLLGSVASELPTQEPLAVGALALLLIAVALFACWLPARRAAALDPMVALRQE